MKVLRVPRWRYSPTKFLSTLLPFWQENLVSNPVYVVYNMYDKIHEKEGITGFILGFCLGRGKHQVPTFWVGGGGRKHPEINPVSYG